MSKKLLIRVLDALNIVNHSSGISGYHLNGEVEPWDRTDFPDLIEEIAAELAKPEAEPVAYMYHWSDGEFFGIFANHHPMKEHGVPITEKALYTEQPDQSERIAELEEELKKAVFSEKYHKMHYESLAKEFTELEKELFDARQAVLTEGQRAVELENKLSDLKPLAERLKQQSEHTHLAPCSGACEAAAFKIEIRDLKKKLAEMQGDSEPVAWLSRHKRSQNIEICAPGETETPDWHAGFPVFDHPLRKQEPLSDEQARSLILDWYEDSISKPACIEFVKYVASRLVA